MTRIYKVLTAGQAQDLAQGQFTGAPIDIADGYIHFSTAEQVGETLRRHFAGQEGLVIAVVEAEALGEALRWEVSRGGALFPHLYGRLTQALVVAQSAVEWDEEGETILPA